MGDRVMKTKITLGESVRDKFSYDLSVFKSVSGSVFNSVDMSVFWPVHRLVRNSINIRL